MLEHLSNSPKVVFLHFHLSPKNISIRLFLQIIFAKLTKQIISTILFLGIAFLTYPMLPDYLNAGENINVFCEILSEIIE